MPSGTTTRVLAGRYELIERIGDGGMAVVYSSRDKLLNRMVAIKILRPEYTKDATFVESFRRESQIAANLVHPNIVSIFDVGRQGNIHFIVMELVDGKPLSEIIKEEGQLDPRWVVSIAREVASALSLAHKSQLIHRDVKPHNIMITKDGVAKITDFGIAKAVSSDTFVGEKKDAVMGSVHYFSPEQARGGYVDERSDIYSLGICMYEMFTGKVPFDGETAVEVAVKHMNEPMPLPSVLRPDIPQDAEDIIMKATDKLQVNRYKNADEMITALNFVRFSRISESSGASVASVNEHGGFGQPQEPEEPEKHEEEPATVIRTAAYASAGAAAQTAEEDDDEEEVMTVKGKKKVSLLKKRWFHRLMALVLAVILAIPASKLVYEKLFKGDENPIKEIKEIKNVIPAAKEEKLVPDLKGKDYEKMKAELEADGIGLEIELELFNNECEKGIIMSQSPAEGTVIKSGQSIRVSVSKGAAQAVVPELISKSYSGARLIIESYGYKVGNVSEAYSDDFRENSVMKQDPIKGTELEPGSKIDLVISKGSEPKAEDPTKLTVNVIGLEYDAAKAKIEGLGLSVGSVTRTSNVSVPENCVISQEPGSSVELSEGASIDLIVSTGPDKPAQEDPAEPVSPEQPAVQDPNAPADPDAPAEPQQPELPEEPQEKSVDLAVDFTRATEDIFLLTVNVSDGVNGSRTPIVKQRTEKAEGSRVITVKGVGPDGRVVIRFDNEIVYDLQVNFETGEVIGY